MLELITITEVNDALAEIVALFRVELRSYKGIVSKPNIDAGREEMQQQDDPNQIGKQKTDVNKSQIIKSRSR